MKRYIPILVFLLGMGLGWFLAIKTIEPKEIIIEKEVEIIKLQAKVDKADIEKKAEYIVRVPFTKVGLTKQFTLGFISGTITSLVVIL